MVVRLVIPACSMSCPTWTLAAFRASEGAGAQTSLHVV